VSTCPRLAKLAGHPDAGDARAGYLAF
jgi:hypothetical protein